MLEIFIISLLAGLSTALGGFLVVRSKRIGEKTLGFGLGFSGGVMVIIAFLSLFFKAVEFGSYTMTAVWFMAGAVLMLALDFFVPHQYFIREKRFKSERQLRFIKVGLLVAVGMTLHNFPEGAVVGIGYSVLPVFGIMLAFAIAIHNIPEGVAIALPLKVAGMKGRKIFLITLLSGLTETMGAIIAALFLFSVPGIIQVALALTSGVMIYLVMDELIPLATKSCNPHSISIGLIAGMGAALVLGALA